MQKTLRFEDVATHIYGDTPLILCSHHDGRADEINGEPLPLLRGRHNDEGTKELTLRTADIIHRTRNIVPYVIIFDINIKASTDEMFDLYIAKVFFAICDCLKRFGTCAVIDIHRFCKHPELTADIYRRHDIWFGTDHRKSVRNDFDKNLAAAITKLYKICFNGEIGVYVPGETEKDGERFGATGKVPGRIILTKAISEAFCDQNVSAVQAEFYTDHLQAGAPVINMAIVLANALLKSI